MSPQSPSGSTSQTRLSSYFSPSTKSKGVKRSSSIVDLTEDSDEERFSKKAREHLTDAPDGSSPSTQAAARWCYDPSSPVKSTQSCGPIPARHSTRTSKREALRRKLLQDSGSTLFPEKTSSEVATDVDTRGVDGDSDSDPGFKKLTEMFSRKPDKGKQKAAPTGARTKRTNEIGPSGEPWTPLEKQVLQLKKENPGTLLMIEVGYKYKFFDEDAKIAARDLGMVCFPDRNFLVASIPIDRRDIHLKNLLSRGHRVGIVNQIETAALKKASENRNTLFKRKLVHLCTAATYVDALDSVDDLGARTPPPFLCIVEEGKTKKGNDVIIAIISICPGTGDVVWDQFQDSPMRLELETRLAHLKPAEILCSRDGLTTPTTKLLSNVLSSSAADGKPRIENFDKQMSYTEAFASVSSFYEGRKKSRLASENLKTGELMASVAEFPQKVVVALAHIISHLSSYNVADALLETRYFTRFTTRSRMVLAANTLSNLEIFENETDHTVHGSLLWVLDRTKTKFGARLLKSWVGQPLIDRIALQERVDAIDEIISSSSEHLVVLRQTLKRLPDLAKGLCRIQYGQCTPQELALLLQTFNKIGLAFEPISKPLDVGFQSTILNEIIYSLPLLRDSMKELLGIISLKHATDGEKDALWLDPERYPTVAETRMALQAVELELQEELKSIRKLLKMPSLQWETVAGEEYLVEVKKSENRPIPPSWLLVSSTKVMARYRPPEVYTKLQERSRWQETLDFEANRAYATFLDEIAQSHYNYMRNAVNKLAVADCLLSLAQVALQPDSSYVRPIFTDDDTIEIVEGRHPMVEALRSDPFIPNTIRMGTSGEPKSKIITGPNMGGKSSSVRMVALIAIMAQIGSYVPAESVKIGLLDSIMTRMGAWDELARGRSTFMVEMSETNEILQSASKRSLVILDELGRGTSTYDSMAIASAVLQHLIQSTNCKTLFITHYPLVAAELEKKFPTQVQNLHMGYAAELRVDGTRDITFLYRLTEGIASESFGVECGRLAGLPEDILRVASQRSSHMQQEVTARIIRQRVRNSMKLIRQCLDGAHNGLVPRLRMLAEAAFESMEEHSSHNE